MALISNPLPPKEFMKPDGIILSEKIEEKKEHWFINVILALGYLTLICLIAGSISWLIIGQNPFKSTEEITGIDYQSGITQNNCLDPDIRINNVDIEYNDLITVLNILDKNNSGLVIQVDHNNIKNAPEKNGRVQLELGNLNPLKYLCLRYNTIN